MKPQSKQDVLPVEQKIMMILAMVYSSGQAGTSYTPEYAVKGMMDVIETAKADAVRNTLDRVESALKGEVLSAMGLQKINTVTAAIRSELANLNSKE